MVVLYPSLQLTQTILLLSSSAEDTQFGDILHRNRGNSCMKFGFGGLKGANGWPARWSKPATSLSRVLTPLVASWMQKKRKKISRAPQVSRQIPVICIGNIVVGGSGKSPLVASLALKLRQAGFTPGIVSRGFGGQAKNLPIEVTANSLPSITARSASSNRPSRGRGASTKSAPSSKTVTDLQ